MFKSATQPFCRYCGKPIAKWTETRFPWTSEGLRLRSQAECQARHNERVVSVGYSGQGKDRYVFHYSLWDGESYQDNAFCTNKHAIAFAKTVVREKPTIGMPAWHKATKP